MQLRMYDNQTVRPGRVPGQGNHDKRHGWKSQQVKPKKEGSMDRHEATRHQGSQAVRQLGIIDDVDSDTV